MQACIRLSCSMVMHVYTGSMHSNSSQPTKRTTVLSELVLQAEQAAESADWAAVRASTTEALSCLQAASNPELAVNLLLLQAQAANHLKEHAGALQALDLAVQLQPSCAEARWLRAAVHAATGNHTASFMDLRTLSQLQPAYPGIAEALQQAAQVLAQHQSSRTQAKAPPRKTYIHTTRRTHAALPSAADKGAAQCSAHAVLGLLPGSSMQDVRKAYKQLASQLHPDKWVLAGPSQQAIAEERFKQVAAAYQSIMEHSTIAE